jgi:ABC-type Fe3+ transport system permease subunit
MLAVGVATANDGSSIQTDCRSLKAGLTLIKPAWPAVWRGILVGALFSFLTSIQEASATIFLTLGGREMMPFGIFTFCIAGSQSQAAALGVVLIAMCALSLYVVNRIAGTRVGGLFG